MTHVSSPLIFSPNHVSFIRCLVHRQCRYYTVDGCLRPGHFSTWLVLRPICTQSRAVCTFPPRTRPPALPFEHTRSVLQATCEPPAKVDCILRYALMPPSCAPCACSKSSETMTSPVTDSPVDVRIHLLVLPTRKQDPASLGSNCKRPLDIANLARRSDFRVLDGM